MKLLLKYKYFKILLFTFLQTATIFSQSAGDYRSNGNGNWTDLSKWQYYNGTTWVTPSGTTPQGYPGQFAGSGIVTIRNGNNIVLSNSTPNNFSSLVIGEGTSGILTIGADVDVKTLNVKINASALVQFSGNNEIRFPANTSIVIDAPGKFDDGGTCNNNVAIYIGSVKFAVCKGEGNSEYTFEQVNIGGGTLTASSTSNSPVCQNGNVSLIGSYSGTVGSTTSSGSIVGVNYSWSIKAPDDSISTSSSPNLNFSANQFGTYTVTFICSTFYGTNQYISSKIIFVIVNAALTPPTIGAITQPTCTASTGSATLTSLPATGTWTITANPATSGLTGLTGAGGSTVIGGLTAGTSYTFAVSSSTCTSAASTTAVINTITTTTYSGSSWSTIPDLNMIGIINSATPIASNVDLCNCTVNSGINATVASGVTLRLQDKLTVNGTLTFEDKASLVQINTVANTGVVNYKRTTNTLVRNTDYTYWSTPVSPLNLAGTGGISYNPTNLRGSIFYSYLATSSSENWTGESATTSMVIGKGYIIRGPILTTTIPPTFLEATFSGVPNNGNYSLTGIFANKSYLIGNPYPSALDADKFLTDNAGVLDGTLYFWTHNTALTLASNLNTGTAGSGAYAYTSDDYASYNLTGGTATAAAPSDVDKSVSNPNIPSGKIGSGQGFFASSKIALSGSAIVFNNNMRVGVVGGIAGNNAQFFRTTKNLKTTAAIEKNRVWLNLYNSQGAFKQTLVGYVTGATNQYDNGYDGATFDGNEFVDFYSINEDKDLTIQGRALPFNENDEVYLGYKSAIVGDFTIAIDQVDGLFSNQDVFIEDKITKSIKNLKEGVYNFSTVAGSFNDRFVLRFVQKTLATDNFTASDNSVLIAKDKNELRIKSALETIKRITVFDLLGRKILDKDAINNSEFRTSTNILNKQVVIVKVMLTNGQVISKKVMY